MGMDEKDTAEILWGLKLLRRDLMTMDIRNGTELLNDIIKFVEEHLDEE